MIEELGNALKETAEEAISLPTFLPRFCNGVESIVGSFDDADEPLNNSGDGETFVTPHWVNEYTTGDGNILGGFWRDGDGDTSIDLTEDEGGGYFRDILE